VPDKETAKVLRSTISQLHYDGRYIIHQNHFGGEVDEVLTLASRLRRLGLAIDDL
jgi:hypothetical protein